MPGEPQLQISYSLLNSWMRGERERVVDMYLHLPTPKTAAMNRGTEFDLYVKEYVTKNNALPPELGGEKLVSPVPDLVLIGDFNEYYRPDLAKFRIKGVLDIFDSGHIIEIKNSTSMDSVEWSDTLQLDFYFLAYYLKEQQHAKSAMLYRYDPTHRTYDRSIVYPSERRVGRAIKAIEEHGTKLYEFLMEEGVL